MAHLGIGIVNGKHQRLFLASQKATGAKQAVAYYKIGFYELYGLKKPKLGISALVYSESLGNKKAAELLKKLEMLPEYTVIVGEVKKSAAETSPGFYRVITLMGNRSE